MQRRRTSVLAVTLALGAVPAPALALRRAAHVRPRAFASCTRLVGYERTHFAVTHGVPETSPRPLSEPSIAAPSPSASGSPQTRRRPSKMRAPPSAEPPSPRPTTRSRASKSQTSSRPTGPPSSPSSRARSTRSLAGGPAPHLAGSLPLGSTGYGAQLLLRGSRLLVISGSQALPARRRRRGTRAPGRCRRPIVCALRRRPRCARSVNVARPSVRRSRPPPTTTPPPPRSPKSTSMILPP